MVLQFSDSPRYVSNEVENVPNARVGGEADVNSEELVLVGVAAPIRLEAEAQYAIPRSTLLTEKACSEQKVQEFLETKFPLGITGREFVNDFLKCLAECIRSSDPDNKYLLKSELTDFFRDKQLDNFDRNFLEQVTLILARAQDAGIIIVTESTGYYPRPEVAKTMYVLNQNPIVLASLDLRTEVTNFNEAEVLGILSEEVLIRNPDHPFRNDLSAASFYNFFATPHSALEAYHEPGFYKPDRDYVPRFVPGTVDGLIEQAVNCGLLQQSEGAGRQPIFTLSAQGKAAVNSALHLTA